MKKNIFSCSIIIFIVTITTFLIYYLYWFKKENYECDDCNLIIISLTNTRKDHVGLYGYNRDTTSNIDSFFKKSLIFNNAFVPTSWTLPNAASLFTSVYPNKHNVINRYKANKIPSEQLTLAEILKSNNYKTTAFTGGGDYNRIYGFDKGFDEYYDGKNFSTITESKQDVVSWLKNNQKKRFFLFVQGFDAHCPFNPSSPYNEKYKIIESDLDISVCYWNLNGENIKNDNGNTLYSVYSQKKNEDHPSNILINENDKNKLIDMYDGAIKQADDSLRDIFSTIDDLNLDKNTIIVFMAEHGDLIGDNGRFMRTDVFGTFSDKVINIPLLIKYPQLKTKKEIYGLVNLVDIVPTLFDFLNVGWTKKNTDGKSLMPLIKDEESVNDYVYGWIKYIGSPDSDFFKDIREISMIRDRENKLISEKKYDLSGVLTDEKYDLYNIGQNLEEIIKVPDEKMMKKYRLLKDLLIK